MFCNPAIIWLWRVKKRCKILIMQTEFCEFVDKRDKSGEVVLRPLGVAKNNVGKTTLPGWKKVSTDIVIEKKFVPGLDGLEKYSHIIVIYWMDKEGECHLRHHPQGKASVPFVGIFACRCPQRPNRIAISTVKLISIKGGIIKVAGLDILDGTPILDIKPYTPQYDEVKKAKIPAWVGKLVF